MRAHEFIFEEKTGKMEKSSSKASTGTESVRDPEGLDRINHLNRLAMAMAMADGKSDTKIKMDPYSWAARSNTIHPYTELEHRMVKQAMKVVPTANKHLVSDHHSRESDEIHHTSPVSSFKGYKKK